jgi:hypothetical protein
MVHIVDSRNNIINPSWKSSMQSSKVFGFFVSAKELPYSRLEIIPSFTTIEVPFELSDIPITK